MEVSDASDWPKAEMREFERKLRCSICQDFFRAAMIIKNCSHNFCSLCIRRALAMTGECPVCRKSAASTDLELNRVLDELVTSFVAVRAMMLAALKTSEPALSQSHPSQQSSLSQSSSLSSVGSSSSTRKSQRLSKAEKPPTAHSNDHVQCPICQGYFSRDKIEEHVDLCLLRGSAAGDTSSKTEPRISPMKRINRPVHNLLKDSEIKKLLVELELPTTGDRDTWIRRHSEFLLMYNAECDAPKPKSMAQLRSELRTIERTWNIKPSVINFGKDDDFEVNTAKYRKTNANHFASLMKNAKKYSKAEAKSNTDGL